jgi:arylsulfatase A-like enzyme
MKITQSISILIASVYLAANPLLVASQGETPADLSWGVPSGNSLELSWTGGAGALSYNVYFGTSESEVSSGAALQVNKSGMTFNAPALAPDTAYYWRVDEVTAGGTSTGLVRSFRTSNRALYTDLTPAQLDQDFFDPPNKHRIVDYQLALGKLTSAPQYGIGGYQPFFYDELYTEGLTGPAKIGPLVDGAYAQERIVWLADDNGYPSGSAGGQVVTNNPEYEVRGVGMVTTTGNGANPVSISTPADCEKMVAAVLYPTSGGNPDYSQGQVQSVLDIGVSTTGLSGDWVLCAFVLYVRDSNTQAQSTTPQFGSTGHFPDLLNSDAIASWLSLIHEPTLAEITDPAAQVEGFYGNEPSLMQLNWNNIVEPYACVSWNDDLFAEFQAMHGYDLKASMGALYDQDDLYAKRVRMHYRQTIADMLSRSYTGQIARWCGERGLVASGHPLLEEYLDLQVANFGDMLKVFSEFQVPALDLPMPEPHQVGTNDWVFHRQFSSMSIRNNDDPRVVALLDPIIGGYSRPDNKPSLESWRLTVNGAVLNGVNHFTSYMNEGAYGKTEFNQMSEYLGRLSMMLTGAERETQVALYYPIEMFQMEYKPIALRWRQRGNQGRQNAWGALQESMVHGGVDYNIVHPDWIQESVIEGGEMKIGSGAYKYLVMPDVEVISSGVLAQIQAFEAAGGTVLWVDDIPTAGVYASEDATVISAVSGYSTVTQAQVPGLIDAPYDADTFSMSFSSSSSFDIARFDRQGRPLYYVVNQSGSSITVDLNDSAGGEVYDPVTGTITPITMPHSVEIGAYDSLVIAGNSAPVFSSGSIGKVNATQSLAYSSSIAGFASDLEGDAMTFSLLSGPDWLDVAADGSLSGTPAAGDLGLNVFTVQVDAIGGSATVTLNLTVNSTRPNVIMILVDDMGWMDSSTYGSAYYETPNLTRLGDAGMLFTNAYAANPLCSPTRASIMSGQHPSRLGLTLAINADTVSNPQALAPSGGKYLGNVEALNHMPLEVNTLAETLKSNGYSTGHIGKWHLTHASAGPGFEAEHQGFDFVIGGAARPGPGSYYSPWGIRNLTDGVPGEYLNDRLADECTLWMDSVKDSGQPFFLNWWQYAVHGPLQAKLDLMSKYEASRDPDYPQHCAEMATMIESMDTAIGRVLDWLDLPENAAIKANTLIMMTSDNGGVIHNKNNTGDTWTSNRPLRGGKANTFEGGVKAPWIVAWPGGIEAGSVNETRIQTIDIYPTILEAVGIAPPGGTVLDGQSIVDILEGTSTEHQPIFTDFPHIFGQLCAPSATVVDGDWKLIRYYHAGIDAGSHAYDLFNLRQDPSESINLEAYRPDKVQELDALIEAHLIATNALVPIANANFTGNPRGSRRTGASQAPDRPNALYLEQPEIQTISAGSLTLNLLDENAQSRLTHGLVSEGGDWVSVENKADGSVLVEWSTPPAGETAKLLFGYKGGLTSAEINDWTYGPYELLLGPDVAPSGGGTEIPVADGSFENPGNVGEVNNSWGTTPTSWNDTGTTPYEVASPGHFAAAAHGYWSGYLGNMQTISQSLGVAVNDGDILEVSFDGGRGLDSNNTAGGGVIECAFFVGGIRYSMTADTTLQTQGTWQQYTHNVTIANTGDLTLEFKSVSGTPWIDHVRNLTVTRASDYNTYISDPAFGLDPAVQGVDADPDGDRIFNGLEAWFGTHPGTYNSGLVLRATDGLTSTFSHPRNASPPSDQSGIYEWSPNLVDWYLGDGIDGSPSGPTVSISPTQSGAIAVASEQIEILFLRICVTKKKH